MTEESSHISQIAANLAAAAEEQVKKIPEHVFVYHFLPLFTGDKPVSDATPATWERVAGNPFMPVDITDDKTGEVIYRVPSLYDIEGLKLAKRREGLPSMTHVLISMQQYARIKPSMGAEYLQRQLDMRNLTHVSPELTKRVDMLNVIFARYNKPLISLDPTGTKAVIDPNKTLNGPSTTDEPGLLYD